MRSRISVKGWLAIVLVAAGMTTSLSAGEQLPEVEAASPWLGSLSTGWDSLYMFRGVNQLPGFRNYGSSISWSALSISYSPTETDSITLSSWSAFGLGESDYKEVDGILSYTKSLGHFSVTGAYSLYAVLSSPGGLYAHEVSAAVAYEVSVGKGTLTPTLEYAYTIGPTIAHGGYVKAGSSYLDLRIDGDYPIFGDTLHAAPWILGGLNFGYNTTGTADGTEPFNGVDHLEMGFSLPIRIREGVTIAPYVAFSHDFASLAGTRSNVTWGGASLTIEF